MAHRERHRTSTRAALAGWLLVALTSCGAGEASSVLAAESPPGTDRGVGLPGAFDPGTLASGTQAPSVSAPVAETRSPRHGSWNARASAIVSRFRAEAVRLAKGKARPDQIQVSIHVRDLATGTELAFLDAGTPRAPASNMKLVTTAAALVLLGPGTEFSTPFEAGGPIRSSTLEGDLVLRAAGDPICGEGDDARVEARLDAAVGQLKERGIRRIAGDVVLDEGTFAGPAPAPGWPDSSQYWQEHCALAGGFSINGGVLQARVTPGAAGARASVAVHPSPHGLRSNYSVGTGTGRKLDVRVGATMTAVTVKGSLPAGRPPFLAQFAHPDPVDLFGAVLMDRLARAGIRVEGKLRRARVEAVGERVAEVRSSVDATLVPINADSRNSVADQLFFAVGHALFGQGNRAAGEAASLRALGQLGVETDGFRQIDGSGLSRDNRVTAGQLTALIAGVLRRDANTASTFRASLAVAGRSGTLANRMRGAATAGNVLGKTGWINGVSALSGVCDTESGQSYVFSILVAYPPRISGLNTKCFKPMQDELLESLITDGADGSGGDGSER